MEPKRPRATAAIAEDGRWTAVGDEAALRQAIPRDAIRLELAGRSALPGFIDAHTHLSHMGADLHLRLDLGGAASLAHALASVRGHLADRADPGRWLVAVNFDESRWPERRYPTREELDGVTRDAPVALRRVDGHMAVANTPALERLAVADPESIRTGIMGRAGVRALRAATRPSAEEHRAAVSAAMGRMLQLGVTGVHDIVSARTGLLLEELDAAGRLPIRVGLIAIHEETGPLSPLLEKIRSAPPDPGRRVHLGGVKLWADGSLGARTAALEEPYADDPTTAGQLSQAPGELESLLEPLLVEGIPTAVHAIGDRAIARVLALHETVAGRRATPTAPHRIEHFEVVNPALLQRARAAGIVASLQPNFVGNWSQPGGMNWARLGTGRGRWCDPIRSVMAAGIPVAFGSDCMPAGPLHGIAAAVNHPVQEERLGMMEAVWAATRGAAAAGDGWAVHGRIAPGCAADLVVLDRDPFDGSGPEGLQVDATVVGGVVAHGPDPPSGTR